MPSEEDWLSNNGALPVHFDNFGNLADLKLKVDFRSLVRLQFNAIL